MGEAATRVKQRLARPLERTGNQGPTAPTAGGDRRLTHRAYERLCEAIITLDLAPGGLVNEKQLGSRLGITRPTLVQALHRLSEAGLVSVLPRRGILVAPIEVLDVQQVFDARSALEGKIAELAAQKATPDDVSALRGLVGALEQPMRDDHEYRRFLDVDRELHIALARLARNRLLEEALERVWMVNRRLWHLFFSERGSARTYFLNHDRIISALEQHDSAAAREAILEHLTSAKELLHRSLWGS